MEKIKQDDSVRGLLKKVLERYDSQGISERHTKAILLSRVFHSLREDADDFPIEHNQLDQYELFQGLDSLGMVALAGVSIEAILLYEESVSDPSVGYYLSSLLKRAAKKINSKEYFEQYKHYLPVDPKERIEFLRDEYSRRSFEISSREYKSI